MACRRRRPSVRPARRRRRTGDAISGGLAQQGNGLGRSGGEISALFGQKRSAGVAGGKGRVLQDADDKIDVGGRPDNVELPDGPQQPFDRLIKGRRGDDDLNDKVTPWCTPRPSTRPWGAHGDLTNGNRTEICSQNDVRLLGTTMRRIQTAHNIQTNTDGGIPAPWERTCRLCGRISGEWGRNSATERGSKTPPPSALSTCSALTHLGQQQIEEW